MNFKAPSQMHDSALNHARQGPIYVSVVTLVFALISKKLGKEVFITKVYKFQINSCCMLFPMDSIRLGFIFLAVYSVGSKWSPYNVFLLFPFTITGSINWRKCILKIFEDPSVRWVTSIHLCNTYLGHSMIFFFNLHIIYTLDRISDGFKMKRSFDTETSENLIDYYYKNLLLREEIYFLTICRNISLINSILRHEEKTYLFFVSLLSVFFHFFCVLLKQTTLSSGVHRLVLKITIFSCHPWQF